MTDEPKRPETPQNAWEQTNRLEIFKHATELELYYDKLGLSGLRFLLGIGASGVLGSRLLSEILPLSTSLGLLLIGWFTVLVYGLWIVITWQQAALQRRRTRPVIIDFYEKNFPLKDVDWKKAWEVTKNWWYPYGLAFGVLFGIMLWASAVFP